MFPVWKTDYSVGPWARTEAGRAGVGACPLTGQTPPQEPEPSRGASQGAASPAAQRSRGTADLCPASCPPVKWGHTARRGPHKVLGTGRAHAAALQSVLFTLDRTSGKRRPRGQEPHLRRRCGRQVGGWALDVEPGARAPAEYPVFLRAREVQGPWTGEADLLMHCAYRSHGTESRPPSPSWC